MPMGLGVRRSVAQEATARSKWENMGVLCPRSLEEWAPNSGKGLSHYNVHQQKLWQQAIFLRWEQKIGVKWPIPRIHLMVIFPFFFLHFCVADKNPFLFGHLFSCPRWTCKYGQVNPWKWAPWSYNSVGDSLTSGTSKFGGLALRKSPLTWHKIQNDQVTRRQWSNGRCRIPVPLATEDLGDWWLGSQFQPLGVGLTMGEPPLVN